MDTQFNVLFAIATAGVSSFFMCIVILLTQPLHARFSMDSDLNGVQKFHSRPVPRIGSVALMVGLLAIPLYIYLFQQNISLHQYAQPMLFAVLAAVPAFATGLFEDITKTVSVRARLIATFLSALLGAWLLGASLNRVDVIGLDFLLQFTPLSLVVTAIAVGGVANSVNIIDGFNGIASGVVTVILGGIAYLAYLVGDTVVMHLCLAGMGAAIGFALINFPTGRLFMGDGGAYLLGFWIGEMAVLLVVRNAQVTAWQLLAICAYPITEVLFSMYRRRVIRKVAPGAPDRLHLHTLIYRRFICTRVPAHPQKDWIRNAAVACLIVPWVAVTTTIAVRYGQTIAGAFLIALFQVLVYLAVYGRLVRRRWCLRPMVLLGFRRVSKETAV
jgi:UDP-N-acetylmuramyl pentapeptide phosphotransferase/UDP-N-acetylglucosamine-1-phosphate transferase